MGLLSLQEAIGYTFTDASLLRLALTHPSLAGESDVQHNQRLEFLGDAVLQLLMTDRLYRAFPDWMEGPLSRLRARSVQESALCEGALQLGLGAYLRLGHGEELNGGRQRPSILADAMEALLGAVYLDGGLAAAQGVASRFLSTASPESARDYKTELQEKLQVGGGETPLYTIIDEQGPAHNRIFVSSATWNGHIIGQGEGSSKKAAEQAAARIALERGCT